MVQDARTFFRGGGAKRNQPVGSGGRALPAPLKHLSFHWVIFLSGLPYPRETTPRMLSRAVR